MLEVLLPLLVLLVSVNSQECVVGEVSSLFPTTRQSQNQGVDVCQWYAANSCCYLNNNDNVPVDLDFTRHVELSIKKIDGEYCSDLFHQALCSVCIASQDGIERTSANGIQITFCADFCDQLYKSCSFARWAGTRDKVTGGYSNAIQFCQSVFSDSMPLLQDRKVSVVVKVAETTADDCLSGAGNVGLMVGVISSLVLKHLVW